MRLCRSNIVESHTCVMCILAGDKRHLPTWNARRIEVDFFFIMYFESLRRHFAVEVDASETTLTYDSLATCI